MQPSPDRTEAPITADVVERIDRILTVLLGALFTTGATWASLAWAFGGWPELVSSAVYGGTVTVAFLVGIPTMWWGWAGRRLPRPIAAVIVATGSIAVMALTMGAGPSAAGVLGGFYTYVTAISFLWFSVPVAVGQLVIAGTTYAVALQQTGAPGPAATWIVSMGIAVGGAGLVGLLGARLRNLYIAESRAAEELREAEQMKHAFLQSVSHELRTPLASVQGFAETLHGRRRELGEEQAELLVERLRDASGRLSLLLTDLLDVERLQRREVAPELAPTDLQEMVSRSLANLEATDHTLEVHVQPGTVHVEASKIERVIVNLVSNAVKHTPTGSRIVLRARPVGGGLRLQVADDGPGLDPELADRLFRPFEQGDHATRAPSPGVGLGLAIVERFVALHGGEVRAGPGLDGAGVTFTVEIPPPSGQPAAAGERVTPRS